ncbi:Aldo/keto reductase [Niveomyces insectorum RCEF 264]|uniref:Aldo/keto reductase n=1 Tax=Niveomyces insectorum RCEF 264 TaxID=1081102 RepID=A0A167Q8Q0_9HYPO|nr:Aldo/keto reductase [Niveomyces insectorum RCEF 264]
MAQVPLRHLGTNGPLVPALGFGCMGLSQSYGPAGDDESRLKVLDKAHEIGARLWDTSDVYGDNEDLLGAWFARTGKRSDIFLCTKFGVKATPGKPYEIRSDPAYVREACEKSLKRLGVSQIDVYYCHRVDLKTPIEKTIAAMVELKREGKIAHIGLSEISAATLRRAHKVHPIAAVQLEYSPFALDIESPEVGLLSACNELGVAVVAYSPLGRGFLTGQLKSPDQFADGDFRKTAPKFSRENWSQNMRLVESLTAIAQTKGCTPGQLALAWVLKQGDNIVAIPGTKRIKYLEENMAALNVDLTEEDVKSIREQVNKNKSVGKRYAGFLEHYSLGETPPLTEA